MARIPLLTGSRLTIASAPDTAEILRPPTPGEAIADVAAAVRDAFRFPLSGEPLEACPFLTDARDGRFLCGIHPTKPAVCRETNTWEWGSGRFGPWGCPVSPP